MFVWTWLVADPKMLGQAARQLHVSLNLAHG